MDQHTDFVQWLGAMSKKLEGMKISPDMESLCTEAHNAIAELEASEEKLQRRILRLELALSVALSVLERYARHGNDAANACRLIRHSFPQSRSCPTLIIDNGVAS